MKPKILLFFYAKYAKTCKLQLLSSYNMQNVSNYCVIAAKSGVHVHKMW